MTRLRITQDGTIRALWTDAVDWHVLGRLAVHRASHVEFDSGEQVWVVKQACPAGTWRRWLRLIPLCPAERVLFRAPTRAAALVWEAWHFGPGGPGWFESNERDGKADACGL